MPQTKQPNFKTPAVLSESLKTNYSGSIPKGQTVLLNHEGVLVAVKVTDPSGPLVGEVVETSALTSRPPASMLEEEDVVEFSQEEIHGIRS